MLDIRFERISMGINEKKTLTPTLKMVDMALRNVGFSDGVWLLKSPHRTRKKGAERFRAIRFDGAGIRIRCKPGGNETCYEWTLFPPAGTDQDLLFSDLCALHPKDLRVVRSATSVRSEATVFGGLMEHLADLKPRLEASPLESARDEQAEDPREDQHEEPPQDKPAVHAEESEDELEREFEEAELVRTQAGASETFARKMPTISSLDISGMESGRLRSDPVLDRALIALGIAMKGTDSIPRGVSSEVMVRKLNIGGLLERSRVYDSLKGAMKAIMMSLHRRGYIERVMGKRNSEGGHWVKGYKMTGKGRKRLAMLAQMLDPSIASELEEQVAEQKDVSPIAFEICSPVKPPIHSEKENPAPKADGEDRIGTIKGMIDEHDAVKRQMADIKELLVESRRERDDDLVLVQGLRKAMEEKAGQMEALKAEMARIEGRAEELESKIRMAEADAESLETEMSDLEVRKIELESGIFSGVRE